jgi:hypothetical protein
MSFVNANLLIQQFVDDYGNTGRNYNVFPFVRRTSQENTKVVLDPNTFLRSGGKLRQVRMTYWPILCDTEGSCDTNICDTGTAIEPKQLMFDITECYASKIYAINKDDIRLIDNDRWDFSGTARQIIVSALPDTRRNLAIDMLTKLYDMAGVHPDGNPVKRVSVTSSTNGVVNPIGKRQIYREYDDAGFSEPNIIGGAEVDNWLQMVAIGGLNAQGQLINRAGVDDAWYDNGLSDQILNDEVNGGHILTIAPEVFKYVWYLDNAGIFSTDLQRLDDLTTLYRRGMGGGFIEGTLVDPVTGIPFDLYVRYNECTGQWNLQLKHRWDFFVMPDVACNLQGVNGIMHWRTCPQVLNECPTGVTPSPAVTPETFSWTPTMANIPSVFTSIIAGYGSVQNEPVATPNVAALAAYMTANSQITFTVNGSAIEYTGVTPITANFNGNVNATFA